MHEIQNKNEYHAGADKYVTTRCLFKLTLGQQTASAKKNRCQIFRRTIDINPESIMISWYNYINNRFIYMFSYYAPEI